jgi:DNA-directed RNA polymerase specialized sigma24 family protein
MSELMRAIEKWRRTEPQRREFFSDQHILQLQPPLTSIEEYERLITAWGRETLIDVVSGYVRGDRNESEDIVQHALERGYKSLKSGGPYPVPRKLLKEVKAQVEAAGETLENLDLYQQEVRVDDPSAWMYTILRNTALHYAGKRKTERATLLWMSYTAKWTDFLIHIRTSSNSTFLRTENSRILLTSLVILILRLEFMRSVASRY